MPLDQCQAIVLHGRDATGNRAGLIPPRRCQRPAKHGDYCGLHAKQAELQALLRGCMVPTWEVKVRVWEERRRQRELASARGALSGLASCAERSDLTRLASLLRARAQALAEAWVAAG